EDYEVDLHGRIIMNWIVSELIYLMVSGILIIVIVGIPLMIAVGVCSIVFPILGAIKVSEGGVYVYPISIDFFGVKRRLF
ncbi:DUF4870 domain-containing protein, partial [bacterium]|nr:DUF4870 domain-containing protein [bacterium]